MSRYAQFLRTFGINWRKEPPGARDEENGEKPKIQITELVEIGNHSTVFSVGESLNLKPSGRWYLMVRFERLCHNYLFHLKMLVVDCRNLVEVAIFGKMLRRLVVSCLLGKLQVACFLLIPRQDDVLSCGVKHNHCQKSHHIWSIVLCVVLG